MSSLSRCRGKCFPGEKQSEVFATGKCTILEKKVSFILHTRSRDVVERRTQEKYGK